MHILPDDTILIYKFKCVIGFMQVRKFLNPAGEHENRKA